MARRTVFSEQPSNLATSATVIKGALLACRNVFVMSLLRWVCRTRSHLFACRQAAEKLNELNQRRM